MNALKKIHEISNMLTDCGIETANKEAQVLVTYCLGIEQVGLYKSNPPLDDKQIIEIDAMAGRRCKREPLQYILGYSYFMGLRILVGSGVLIPRPETELMAEHAIQKVRSKKSEVRSQNNCNMRILDLCTGSGCLALALAREFPDAHVLGTDISETALDYSKRNAVLNKINNVEFVRGHLFDPLYRQDSPAPLYDFIISNPPYIGTDVIPTLQPEIRNWEPVGALDGGADGLTFYREIITQAGKFLKTNGILMLELGLGSADETVRMMKDAGYAEIGLQKDYAGIERILQGKWTN